AGRCNAPANQAKRKYREHRHYLAPARLRQGNSSREHADDPGARTDGGQDRSQAAGPHGFNRKLSAWKLIWRQVAGVLHQGAGTQPDQRVETEVKGDENGKYHLADGCRETLLLLEEDIGGQSQQRKAYQIEYVENDPPLHMRGYRLI